MRLGVFDRLPAPLSEFGLAFFEYKVEDEELKKFSRFSKLKSLHLEDPVITDEGLKSLAGLQNLNELTLSMTRKSLITAKGLQEVTHLQNLTVLTLSGENVTDEGLGDLAKLEELTELTIRSTRITDQTLREVAKLKNLNTLKLYQNEHLTDAGMKEISKLPGLTSLAVNAGGTEYQKSQIKISDESLKEIGALQNLTKLELHSSLLFTDAGFKELSNLKFLLFLTKTFQGGRSLHAFLGQSQYFWIKGSVTPLKSHQSQSWQ